MARQIDNTYCEPDYWIGATLLQQGNDLDLGLQVGGRPHPPPPSMQTYITYTPPPFLATTVNARLHISVSEAVSESVGPTCVLPVPPIHFKYIRKC